MITIIKEDFIESIQSELANFDYQFVYVSIGSKFNRSYCKINEKDVKSNASYQMIPKFLKKEKQLIIIIDRFKDAKNLQDHITVLNKNIGSNKCIILNTYIEINQISNILDVLLPKLFDHYVDPNNFIIANFVKFANRPNLFERESEKLIPLKIKEYLDRFQDKTYKGCFYQWFGYSSYYLYNYIYNNEIFEYMNVQVSDLIELEAAVKDFDYLRKHETVVIQNDRLLIILDEIISLREEVDSNQFTISKRKIEKKNNKLIEI